MATRTQKFNGVPNGVAPSSSNTVTAGDTAMSTTTTPGTGTVSVLGTTAAGEVIEGAASVKGVYTGNASGFTASNRSGAATVGALAGWYRLPVTTPTASCQLGVVRNTGGRSAAVSILTSGKMKFSTGSADLFTMPTALTAGDYYVTIAVDTGTAANNDGRMAFAVYDANGNLAGGMVSGDTAVRTALAGVGSGAFLSVDQVGGKCDTNALTTTWVAEWDSITSNDTFGLLPFPTASANTAPSVSPGSTQTVSGTTASLSGTATDSVSVSTAVWSLLSSTGSTAPTVGATSNTGTGSGSMTATASVTGLLPGTHVFRLTASDGTLSGTGDVTIYVPALTVAPNRVVSNAGNWVAVNAASLWAAVNKADNDPNMDASYIETPATPNNASIVLGVEPIAAGDGTVPFRARYQGTGTFTCTPKLYSGTTLITTSAAPITLTASFANYSVALSPSENAAVANRNDVRVELVATQS